MGLRTHAKLKEIRRRWADTQRAGAGSSKDIVAGEHCRWVLQAGIAGGGTTGGRRALCEDEHGCAPTQNACLNISGGVVLSAAILAGVETESVPPCAPSEGLGGRRQRHARGNLRVTRQSRAGV